jgi:glycosyltransferase involved in cell wall biosynthesis
MPSRNRLKILFLAAWYPSEKKPLSGIFIREHAKAASLYNDVTVIAYSDGCRSLKKLYEISENIEDGIKTYRITHKKLRVRKWKHFIRWWAVIRLFRNLYKKNIKPNVIHAHVYDAGVPAVILGRLHKIQVIITEHWSGFARRKPGKFKQKMARFSLNRSRVILPVSKNLIEHIQSYGIQNEFIVVPNVVNTNIFYPAPNSTNSNRRRKRILTVASLIPIKGISYLLEALHRVKQRRQDFLLDIVGDGINRAEYEKMTVDLGLSNVVVFHGILKKKKVAEAMRGCDFFVLPSLWENMPVVLIEAMACGKPIVATDVGGVSEIVDKVSGLLLPSKDFRALEKDIEYMLDNYENYQPKKVADYARKKFSYSVVGSELDRVYRECLLN